MMKIKLTNKTVKSAFRNIRRAGYCELQHLLRGTQPVAYTCGIYGWNYDVYEVHGITICTGYRNMPGVSLIETSEFEEAARNIWEDYNRPWDERQKEVYELLENFCKINGGY